MISFEHASFSYRIPAAAMSKGQAGPVPSGPAGVEDVSFSVAPGEVVVLCGRSGCGKSTLLRLANGLAPRFFLGEKRGRVLLEGDEVGTLSTWEIAGRAGSLFQNPRTQFFNVDTTGEVAFALESAGWPEGDIRTRVCETFDELDLSSLAGCDIFELSGGERQKVAFAGIWALHPANLLLDEPTSNLDLPSIADMAAFVAHAKAAGCSVLVAEHRLSWLAGIADRYVYLDKGHIARIMDATEFASLDAGEVARMGLRVRSLDEVQPAVASTARATVASTVVADRSFASDTCGEPPLLAARNLALDYGVTPVLRAVDMELHAGEVCALVGSNGAGKTTLCRSLCGFERRARGAVSVDGTTASRRERMRVSSMVFQDVNYQLFAEDVASEVTFGLPRRAAGSVDVAGILSQLALEGLDDRHPATLSGGQKQRLAVAACVAADKRVLVFDEPTSGLDLDGMRLVARLLGQLAAQGRAVLVVTHDLELVASACGCVLPLDDGRAGPPVSVGGHFDTVKAMMGVPTSG